MLVKSIVFTVIACVSTIFASESVYAQGYPTCFNVQGIPVTYFPNPNVNDIAMATTAPNGSPVVIWNPNIAASLHPATLEFFYYHECAHHALGHPLGSYGPGSERMADCWAKQTMMQIGVITQNKYNIIIQQLLQYSTPNIDWPNGHVRTSYLNNC